MKTILILAVLLAVTTPAFGCAVCDSEIGSAVRAGIFNDALPVTLLKVLMPFPLFALAVHFVTRHLPD